VNDCDKIFKNPLAKTFAIPEQIFDQSHDKNNNFYVPTTETLAHSKKF